MRAAGKVDTIDPMFLSSTAPVARPRPVSRGMRSLLYTLTALTFVVGTQLVVLAEHTDQFFAWNIDEPMSAAFVGAGFWSAATVVFWCARQRDWVRARMIVPTIAVVATMLLVATVQHLEVMHGPIGLAWIEVYAVFPPLLASIAVMQLLVPGHTRHSGSWLPRGLRIALGAQALAALAAGAALYADPGTTLSWWPWPLTDLTSKAVGTWLVGIGLTSGFVTVADDRAVLPGWGLAQVVLGGGVLFNVARFIGDIDVNSLGAWILLTGFAATLLTGAWSSWLSWREGRYAPTGGLGGLPVELRALSHEQDCSQHVLRHRVSG